MENRLKLKSFTRQKEALKITTPPLQNNPRHFYTDASKTQEST